MDKRTVLAVAMALLVGLQAFAGGVSAASGMEVERAEIADSSDGETSDGLTYTFTADSNETVSVENSLSDGDVTFEFVRWDEVGGSQSGSSSTWDVEAGTEYRVSYQVTVPESASGYYSVYTASYGSVAREQLTVDVLEPQMGYISTQYPDLAFESQNEGTTEHEVSIENTGDGLMKPEEVTFSGVPSGFDVDYSNLADEISAGGSDTVTIEMTADSSVDEGTYQFDATVTDNLDNTQTFEVQVNVEKPPVLGIEDGAEVDLGDVLAGGEKTREFVITEEAGYNGISGVDSEVTTSDQYGSISFDGLNYVRASAGESDTAEVTVSVDENAGQHGNLEWDVFLEPDDEHGVGKEVTFTGRVIYPAELGALSMSETSMVFDQPKSQVSSHTETVTVEVPNEGDLEMNVQDVSAQVDSGEVSASVVDSPDTIGGTDSGEVEVEVEADPDTPEGSYSLDVTVDTEDAGSETVTEDVEVSHDVSLSVESTELSYGDVIVTENLTESTDVAEELEYEDVTDLSVTKVSGPDEWLTVVDRPSSTLSAGEAAPFVVALRFDTSAELYREYTWEYRVSGENIESQTITVTATAEPYSFEEIRDPLAEYTGSNDWRAETAGGMVSTLDSLEDRLRGDDDVPQNDLTTSMAAGQSALLFVESVEDARETRSSDGNEAAQDEVVRAAATYNLLDSYVTELEDDELRASAEGSRTAAEDTVDQLVESQREHYQSRLDSGDVSMIERAHIKRQLAELAALQGDADRAERLRDESTEAFDSYTETVAEGNDQRRAARDTNEELRESTAVVVFDQPVVVNPAEWDAFDEQSGAVLASYDDAEASFEAAGATEEADRVRSERQEVASTLQLARYSLYGSTAVSVVLFLGLLGHLGRGTYAYVRDARESVSGDFLVAS